MPDQTIKYQIDIDEAGLGAKVTAIFQGVAEKFNASGVGIGGGAASSSTVSAPTKISGGGGIGVQAGTFIELIASHTSKLYDIGETLELMAANTGQILAKITGGSGSGAPSGPPPIPASALLPKGLPNAAKNALPQTFGQGLIQGIGGAAGLPSQLTGALSGNASTLAAAAGPAAKGAAIVLQIRNSIDAMQKLVGAITELGGTMLKTSLSFAANPSGSAAFTAAGAGITAVGKGAEASLQGIGGSILGPIIKGLAAPIVVVGQATSALGTMTEAAKAAAESLSEYNGALFSAMTEYKLFTMGLQIDMAQKLAGPLSSVLKNLEKLAVALEPLIVRIVEVFSGFIDKITPFIERTLQVMAVAEAELEKFAIYLGEFVEKLGDAIMALATGNLTALLAPSGQKHAAMKDAAAERLATALSKLMLPLSSIDDQLKKMTDEGQMIRNGLFKAAEDFGKHRPGTHIHGMQVGGKGHENMNFQNVPNGVGVQEAPFGPAGMNPAMKFLGGAANAQNSGRPVPVIPRPAPAAMHLHTADQVTINASDYQMLHEEMMMQADRVWSYLREANTGAWRRMVGARYGARTIQ